MDVAVGAVEVGEGEAVGQRGWGRGGEDFVEVRWGWGGGGHGFGRRVEERGLFQRKDWSGGVDIFLDRGWDGWEG